MSVLSCYRSNPLLPARKSREREGKWLKMLDHWDDWMERKRTKVRVQCDLSLTNHTHLAFSIAQWMDGWMPEIGQNASGIESFVCDEPADCLIQLRRSYLVFP